MQKNPISSRAALLSLLALLASACSSAAPHKTESAKTMNESSQALWQQIKDEVGDAACDGPQQCHSMAVGAKACGGPEGYLAWSAKRSDEAKLRSLVNAHAQARKDENAKSGMLSDCRVVPDPGATCQAGRCVLLPQGSGAKTAD